MAKNLIELDPKGPITFTGEVEIPAPEGAKLVDFTFKHRDRVELAALLDQYIKQSKDIAEPEGEIDLASAAKDAIESDVQAIKDVASGWGLDASFTDDNLRKLCRLYQGAAGAVLTRYRVLLTQGRLGN